MPTMQWIRDQYRMALEFNEAYMPALRGIPDRIRSGELTPAEGKRLFELYEKTKEEMDRHIADVREIEAEIDRKFNVEKHGTD